MDIARRSGFDAAKPERPEKGEELKIVDLRGQMPGSPAANQGAANKTEGCTIHWNGPPTRVKTKEQAIQLWKNDAAFHMRIDWGGGARANGIQYHYGVWDDTLYILRDYAAILWHCGNTHYNTRSPAINVPIGTGERAPAETLRTLAAAVERINSDWGVAKRAVFGHQEITPTECPGTLMADFVRPFRAGKDFGGEDSPPSGVLHRVQIGWFSRRSGAEKRLAEARSKGYSDAFITPRKGGFAVQIGAFSKRANSEKLAAEAKQKGFTDAFIVTR